MRINEKHTKHKIIKTENQKLKRKKKNSNSRRMEILYKASVFLKKISDCETKPKKT